jgi:hypothetical protein
MSFGDVQRDGFGLSILLAAGMLSWLLKCFPSYKLQSCPSGMCSATALI